jgi:hypothetical protein
MLPINLSPNSGLAHDLTLLLLHFPNTALRVILNQHFTFSWVVILISHESATIDGFSVPTFATKE